MEKLGTVLMHIKEYKWFHALYLPEAETWHLNSKCLVLDPNDVEDDSEDIPADAKNNQFGGGRFVMKIKDGVIELASKMLIK